MKKLIFFCIVYTIFSTKLISQIENEEIISLSYDTSGYLENANRPSTSITSQSTVSDEVIPTVQAHMSVNKTGALEYSLPIEVLEGIFNFQPNLTLSYSSQAGNGQAGWGWNIMGLSLISQGGTSKEVDGITRGPQFTGKDPFYMDGQRLIQINPNCFETLLFSKIKISKNTENDYSFIVNYPDGKIGKYKEIVSGQHYISTFIDAIGNEIHYEYSLDFGTPYIKRVSYGGRSPSTDTYYINFLFKEKKYPIKSYKNGFEYINKKIVSQIVVSSTYTGVYRKYHLTHDIMSNKNERLRIIEVENGEGKKLKPLTFKYNDSNESKIDKRIVKNNGFKHANVKKLESIATADFQGNGINFPIYTMETHEGTKIYNSNLDSFIPVQADADTQLFSGKILLNNGTLPNYNHLIIINTEFTGKDDYKDGFYTPFVKVKIDIWDDLLRNSRKLSFTAKGQYVRKTNTKPVQCGRGAPDCSEYIRSKGINNIKIGDFNNDGLTDMIIENNMSSCNVREGGRPYINPNLKIIYPKPIFYFIEIGKILKQGEISPNIFDSEISFSDEDYLVDLDGDGIPEIINTRTTPRSVIVGSPNPKPSVNEDNYKYYIKIDTYSKKIKKIKFDNYNIPKIGNGKGIFWGDFNGDGLMDYIQPSRFYEIYSDSKGKYIVSAQEVMNEINSNNHYWNLFINTGKGFIKRELNLSKEKLAYISPSQRVVSKKSSAWNKFWSGKSEKYKFTEYGTSYIIPTDFDNDGKTDIISIRKFSRIKQNDDYLNNLTVENHLQNINNANIIEFYKNSTDSKGNITFIKLDTQIPIANISISPISLLINHSDYNQLNTYKSGFTINDPITGKNLIIEIDNDFFMETYLKLIDNGSGINQSIEYHPMVNLKTTSEAKQIYNYNLYNDDLKKISKYPLDVYTLSSSAFTYPFYQNANQGSLYLVNKINTLFDSKSITTEYRYVDGIQHLEGKGFLGFRKTLISDSYESELVRITIKKPIDNRPTTNPIIIGGRNPNPGINNPKSDGRGSSIQGGRNSNSGSRDGNSIPRDRIPNSGGNNPISNDRGSSIQGSRNPISGDRGTTSENKGVLFYWTYQQKNLKTEPVFWTINTFNPYYDMSLISNTYGSLDDESIFTRNTISYKKFDKGYKRYLILPDHEENKDYLKKIQTDKFYSYDSKNLYLIESINKLNDGTSSVQTSRYTYANDFSNGKHMFSGLIVKSEEILSRGGSQFSTRNETYYNKSGLILQTKKYGHNTSPIITDYSYDYFGNVVKETVSSQGVSPLITNYEYDATHRYIVAVTSPEGLKEKRNVNAFGLLISKTSPLGLKSTYTYDSWNNLIESTNYLGIKTKIIRKSLPKGKYEISNHTDGESPLIEVYDQFDRKIQSRTRSLGKWVYTQFEYDIFGKEIRTSQPYFEGDNILWNSTVYDFLNRPVQKTLFTGKIISTCYQGLQVTIKDGEKEVSRKLDATGKVIEHRDFGGKIFYDYYPNGTLKETRYDDIVIKNIQDGWGNIIKTEDPSAGTYEYTYDNLGRLLKEITPKGSTSFVYDAFGKISKETLQGDNTFIEKNYIYDPVSKLPLKINGKCNGKDYSYETYYDKYYRIIGKKEKTPFMNIESKNTFDSFGRIDVVTLKAYIPEISHTSTSQFQNQYNAYGDLIRQIDKGSGTLIREIQDMNSQGQLIRSKYGNGYILQNQYNSLFYLESIKHQKENQVAMSTHYQYDAIKGILNKRSNDIFNKNETFQYDYLERLETEKSDNNNIRNFYYDNSGKMIYNSDLGEYEYLKNNYQLKKITYNEIGMNLKRSRGFHEIVYNAFKNPTDIRLSYKEHIQYEYGILKKRSASYFGKNTSNPKHTYYSSDGCVEVNKIGSSYKIITYVNGDGYSADYIKIDELKHSSLLHSKNYFLHRDHMQSIVAITDAKTGEIAEQRFFDAWGNLKEVRSKAFTNRKWMYNLYDLENLSSKILITRGYTGHEHLLSVGLIHMNGRLYDPELRRFLSPDNYIQDLYNTQTYNRYTYVLNNPLIYTDPSGEFIPILIGIGTGILTHAINNSMHGVPFWYGMGKAIVISAASSAISFGIGAAVSNIHNGITKAALQAGMHGVSGGVISAIDGGNFLSGFSSATISSLTSSGIERLGVNKSNELTKFGRSNYFRAVMIASGGITGGISANIAGGNFWMGVRQGLITSGVNHVAHQMQTKTYANVYIETDGVGHVYVEIDGVVYSYGRYDGSYSPESGSLAPMGDGVLLILEGENATNFIAERNAKYPTDKYSVKVDGEKVKAYYNKLYDSGTPLIGKDSYYKYGRAIDTYNLIGPGGNNCTTITYKALNFGGANILPAQTPWGMKYDFQQLQYYKQGYDPSRSIRGPK